MFRLLVVFFACLSYYNNACQKCINSETTQSSRKFITPDEDECCLEILKWWLDFTTKLGNSFVESFLAFPRCIINTVNDLSTLYVTGLPVSEICKQERGTDEQRDSLIKQGDNEAQNTREGHQVDEIEALKSKVRVTVAHLMKSVEPKSDETATGKKKEFTVSAALTGSREKEIKTDVPRRRQHEAVVETGDGNVTGTLKPVNVTVSNERDVTDGDAIVEAKEVGTEYKSVPSDGIQASKSRTNQDRTTPKETFRREVPFHTVEEVNLDYASERGDLEDCLEVNKDTGNTLSRCRKRLTTSEEVDMLLTTFKNEKNEAPFDIMKRLFRL